MAMMSKAYMVRKNHKSAAFTIVELLIVIVVIGILAAIVIVAFNGVQSRAVDSTVRSDLTQMAKKLEMYKATNGRYPTGASELADADIKLSRNHYRLTNTDGSARNNVYYIVSSATHPDGLGQHYAVGTLPLNGVTNTICLDDGVLVVGSCSGGDATRAFISADSSETAWAGTGYSSTDGWASWTE